MRRNNPKYHSSTAPKAQTPVNINHRKSGMRSVGKLPSRTWTAIEDTITFWLALSLDREALTDVPDSGAAERPVQVVYEPGQQGNRHDWLPFPRPPGRVGYLPKHSRAGGPGCVVQAWRSYCWPQHRRWCAPPSGPCGSGT